MRMKGTKITADEMKKLHKYSAPVRIFAGGKTFADVNMDDIPQKDIQNLPSIIVKSRGNIEFEYYDKLFSHKAEFWSYHPSVKNIDTKFVWHYLKMNESYFQNIGNKMSKMPQISSKDTDYFNIPLLPLSEQKRIVSVLDKFEMLVNNISIGLPAEIKARRSQYEYYRAKLLTFNEYAS